MDVASVSLSAERFKSMIKGIGSDFFVMDELKEAFEEQGEEALVRTKGKITDLIDHYLPEQAGYGIFHKDNINCIGLLWSAGVDLLDIAPEDETTREQTEDKT